MLPGRPEVDEYASFYADYVARVPDGDIVAILSTQLEQLHALLTPLSQEQLQLRPTPTDWNALEVLGHITDGEQVFAYRALRIARGDTTPLAGFDQDQFVQAAQYGEQSLDQLLATYIAMRRATIALFTTFNLDAWHRRGTVSGHPASARAWAYIAAGHELHHIADFAVRYGIGTSIS
jgi:DinB superfamily